MTSPVVFLAFNRPNHTARTFEAVRAARPQQLFIVADGPREEHPEDTEQCAAVRAVVEQVDWPCDVRRDYAESNLGLKRRVSSGLDWVFGQVDRAIILEDDCLPHPDFFSFCDELLERYADDNRVWVITGNNFQNGRKRGDATYYFSRYNHCWGWATWRRAWQHYCGELAFWPEWSSTEEWIQQTPDRKERAYWSGVFERVYAGQINSWSFPWTASVWYHGGLTATPNVNLVGNIGFGAEATHTTATSSALAELPTCSLGGLRHPVPIEQDLAADRYVFDHAFGGRKLRLPWALGRLSQRSAKFLYRQLRRALA